MTIKTLTYFGFTLFNRSFKYLRKICVGALIYQADDVIIRF
jgi:hypothetical protein